MKGRQAVLLLLSLALGGGCSSGAAPPNIFLVVIDTLRADRVGAYGGPQGLTPFLDSLAASGRFYQRAYATSAFTSPSVASLLTSRLPSQTGILRFHQVLASSEMTIAELLKRRGYSTTAIIANPLIGPSLGYNQGFDYFLTLREPAGSGAKASADKLNERAITRLDALAASSSRGPHFVYLHFMDVHSPYSPREEDLRFVRGSRAKSDLARVNAAMRTQSTTAFDPRLARDIRDSYDAAIRSLDSELASFFERVRARSLLENSVIVVTSDHGEEFWEHGRLGHGKALYQESLRVPLIIAMSGQRGEGVVDEVVSLLDVAPTLLELAGVSVHPAFEGSSVMSSSGVRPSRSPALAELRSIRPDDPHRRAVIDGDAKLIESSEGTLEFYDLAADDAESDPNALDDVQRSALRERSAWLKALAEQPKAPTQRTAPLDDQTLRQLEALGYAR